MPEIKKIVSRISEIDKRLKQITFLDSRFYKKENGEHYPSITQILKCWPKGAHFDNWLKEHGMNADFIAAKSAHSGTQTHELIERYLKGDKLEWLDKNSSANYPLEVWRMVLRFVDFWEKFKPTLIHSEIHLYSDIHKIAGTVDLVLEINNEIWLLDIKTSNHIVDSYDLQTAAYAICWNETFEEKIHHTGILWLKSSKHGYKEGKMQGKGWEIRESDRTIEENWKLFEYTHEIYKIVYPNDKPIFDSFPTTIQLKS